VTHATNTREQDVVAAKGQLASLKDAYMTALQAYFKVDSKQREQLCDAVLECQRRGNAYFNYSEEFVGNSDLLGAHKSPLWAQGFAEDCAEILRSLPGHLAFLEAATEQSAMACSPDMLRPGPTAYANMQRMVVRYLDAKEAGALKDLLMKANLPTYGFQNEAREFMNKKTQMFMSFGFGVTFVIVLIVLSIAFPEPTRLQYQVFRTVLSLAGAGVVALFPGFIEVKFGNWLRAGGALAVFAILYFMNPAQLAAPDPSHPTKIVSGQPKS
jgi:hypothetical protein